VRGNELDNTFMDSYEPSQRQAEGEGRGEERVEVETDD
jgi:hypothetical protein